MTIHVGHFDECEEQSLYMYIKKNRTGGNMLDLQVIQTLGLLDKQTTRQSKLHLAISSPPDIVQYLVKEFLQSWQFTYTQCFCKNTFSEENN